MKSKSQVTVLRRSCLTGNVVWMFHGLKHRVYDAYRYACIREANYQRMWPERWSQRRTNILRFLSACLANFQMTEALPIQLEDAARTLRNISDEHIAVDRSFYDHILADRERRMQTLSDLRAKKRINIMFN